MLGGKFVKLVQTSFIIAALFLSPIAAQGNERVVGIVF
jgi:hypothetical protein